MSDKTPAQIEAEGDEMVTVEFDGHSYEFPSSLEDVDGDVIDAIDDMKISHALKALMGSAGWKSFKATKPKATQYMELFMAYAERIGLPTTEGN